MKATYLRRGGLSETVHTDRAAPGVVFNTVSEQIQPLRDHAELLRHAQEHRTKAELADCRVRAVIPMTVYLQSLKEHWDQKKWRKWLGDPENSHLIVSGFVPRHGV
jgi:hypothetical protein